MTDVDDLRRLERRVVAGENHLARVDQSSILAGEPHRGPAVAVDEIDDLLVHQAPEHHLDDAHRFVVGDAHAFYELRFLADALEEFADLRTAAMHHDRIHADLLHQHQVPGEAVLELLIDHRVAAVLDDQGLAAVALNVGQRLGKDMRNRHRVIALQ